MMFGREGVIHVIKGALGVAEGGGGGATMI